MVKGGKGASDKGGRGKGGKSDGAPKSSAPPMSKKRMLDKMTSLSLNADDDERTQMSKKISWVLRQGQSGICEPHAWAKVEDLLSLPVFDGMGLDKLMAVVAESNQQKLRYETRNGNTEIRAIPKNERKAQEGSVKKPVAPSGAAPSLTAAVDGSKLNPNAPVFERSPQAIAAAATQGTYASMNAFGYANPYMQNPWAMMGMGMGMGYNPMSMYGQMPMMTPGMGGAASTAGKYRGRIKSFNADKGFGFIDSQDAKAQYGRDVFLHKAAIGDLKTGDDVMFSVELNKQNMPQAREVTLAVGGGGGGKGKGKGAGKGAPKAKAKTKAKGKGEPKEAGEVKEGEGKDAAPAAAGESSAPAAEAAPAAEKEDA